MNDESLDAVSNTESSHSNAAYTMGTPSSRKGTPSAANHHYYASSSCSKQSTSRVVSGALQFQPRDSLTQFTESELSKTVNLLSDQNNLPFKYRTIVYVRKILACPEVEQDAKDFIMKTGGGYKQGQYKDQIDKDIKRTRFLKDNDKLHEDVHKVLEFYCFSKNVTYCQGMIEVLVPFLLMKQ